MSDQPNETNEQTEHSSSTAKIAVLNTGRQAAEQAADYGSVFAPTPLRLDNGDTIQVPPHPNLRMFDDDALEELDQLDFDLESYDRLPDIFIPEQRVQDRDGNMLVLPAETKEGPLRTPYRKTDPETKKTVLLKPPYPVRVAQIALRKTDYARLRNSTIDGHRGSAADIWRIWNEQATDLQERRAADPKSDGGSGVLEDVAATHSQRPEQVPPPSDS